MPSKPDYSFWSKKVSELGELFYESPDKARESALAIRQNTLETEHLKLAADALAVLAIWYSIRGNRRMEIRCLRTHTRYPSSTEQRF